MNGEVSFPHRIGPHRVVAFTLIGAAPGTRSHQGVAITQDEDRFNVHSVFLADREIGRWKDRTAGTASPGNAPWTRWSTAPPPHLHEPKPAPATPSRGSPGHGVPGLTMAANKEVYVDEYVRADATVTVTLNAEMAMLLMSGIRRMDNSWVKSLTNEEADRKIEPDIHAARNLPNHIARALRDLGEKLGTAEVVFGSPVKIIE